MHKRLSLAVLLFSASLYGMEEHQQEKDPQTVLGKVICALRRTVSAEELPQIPESEEELQEEKSAPAPERPANSQKPAEVSTRSIAPPFCYYEHACMGGVSVVCRSDDDGTVPETLFP